MFIGQFNAQNAGFGGKEPRPISTAVRSLGMTFPEG
jgi:hypothetical protein